ncbi:LacI family DNA-binding transcriptional regulator [Paenibacillus marinisediminis]
MKSTIRDVAQYANVSISTVSRVMNAPETVVEEKRVRVMEAIQALQYQPNAFARGLIFKKSNTFGVMIPDLENPYYSGLIRGMQDAAVELNHSLIFCNTDRDRDQLHSYIQYFVEKQVDGVIYTSEPLYPEYYEHMKRYNLPFVLASTNSAEYDIPSVDINEELAGYEAVQHLIAGGHRQIGMVGFPLTESVSGVPRYEGFMRALQENGLGDCTKCVEFAELRYEKAYEATGRLISRYPELTAIFAISDVFAMGVISYLHDHGIKVPEQISVIGFDNIRMANMFIPKLSTIAQPIYDIGFRAVQKLHELISAGQVAILREKLPHELIIRDSSRAK